MKEVWKEIKGFEGKYFISDKGRVWANTQMGKRILNPWINSHGYKYVELYGKNTKSKLVSVHRLVALGFVENPHDKTDVNHIDGVKLNNDASNLEWVTPVENTIHAHKTGLIPKVTFRQGGANNPSAKLTKKEVEEIRLAYDCDNRSISELAIIFGVHYTTISRVLKRKSWK